MGRKARQQQEVTAADLGVGIGHERGGDPVAFQQRREPEGAGLDLALWDLAGKLTGRSLAPDRWVFVVGCYNSGTTLLANLLEAHPAINGLAREGVELTDALRRPELAGWPRMCWAGRASARKA